MVKTYSINKASYILSQGCEIKYSIDTVDKVYYIFEQPLASVYANEYEQNEELRKFLNAYKEIRNQTRFIKDVCNIK